MPVSDRKIVISNYVTAQDNAIQYGRSKILEEVDLTPAPDLTWRQGALGRYGTKTEVQIDSDQADQAWASFEHPRKVFELYDDIAYADPTGNAGLDDWDANGHFFDNSYEVPSSSEAPSGVQLSTVGTRCAVLYIKNISPIVNRAEIEFNGDGMWDIQVGQGEAIAITPYEVLCSGIKVRSSENVPLTIQYIVSRL